jgi:beta-1,4-mannosyltransferase
VNVIFFPHWTGNPYQELLVKHLAHESVFIELSDEKPGSLPTAIRNRKPEIIHFHAIYPFFLAPTTLESIFLLVKSTAKIIYLKLIGIKIVWTVHDLKNHENHQLKSDKFFSKIFYKLSDQVIVHTNIGKKQFAKAFSVSDTNKISVIPHGNFIPCYKNQISRSEARHSLGISEEKFVVLFLGLIRPYKGVPKLIDTFKKIATDSDQLIIAGRIVTVRLLAEINKSIGDCTNIVFSPGHVPDDQIQVYMNSCDVVVLPYLDIFTSGAAVLAMSFGKPCVAPRKGCMEDMLDDLGSFLYNPEEEDGLLNALKRSTEAKNKLLQMGLHNRAIAETWDWPKVAAMTAEVYETCLHH